MHAVRDVEFAFTDPTQGFFLETEERRKLSKISTISEKYSVFRLSTKIARNAGRRPLFVRHLRVENFRFPQFRPQNTQFLCPESSFKTDDHVGV